ncbi:hypothetical protein K2X85_12215 [bacterium]|nr:hypothetical protein [bacterium]
MIQRTRAARHGGKEAEHDGRVCIVASMVDHVFGAYIIHRNIAREPIDQEFANLMQVDLLIVTAIVSEFSSIAEGIGPSGRRHEDYRLQVNRLGGKTVVLMQMGMGPSRARRAMKWAFEHIDPACVIMVGIAGGLDPALPLATKVVPFRVIDEHQGEITLTEKHPWFEETSPKTSLLQTDRIILQATQKSELFVRTGARAVDMESLAVARACNEAGRPIQVVRFVSDRAGDSLPSEIVGLVDEAGNPRLMTALGRIIRRPTLLRELLTIERSNKLVATAMRSWGRELRARITERS